MTTPLLGYIVQPNSERYRWYREVDNHYHLDLVARGQEQLVAVQTAALKVQASYAVASLAELSEIGERQSLTNDLLASAGGTLVDIRDGLGTLGEQLGDILTSVDTLAVVLREGFDRIASTMIQVQNDLETIAKVLGHPYQTQLLELRGEAARWLKQGMQQTGSDRAEDFEDALRLLRLCVENPVGNQDSVAWFQIGWLLWRHKDNLVQAEAAFDRARRLSEPRFDQYYLLSLRHLASMQFKQGNLASAYRTATALGAFGDHAESVYDLARYAAACGRNDEALARLEKAITLRPANLIAMYEDDAFAGLRSELAGLHRNLLTDARNRAIASIAKFTAAVESASATVAGANAQEVIPRPALGSALLEERARELADGTYFLALETERAVEGATTTFQRAAVAALNELVKLQTQQLSVLERQQKRLAADRQDALNRLQESSKAARKEAQNLPLKKSWIAGMIVLDVIFVIEFILEGGRSPGMLVAAFLLVSPVFGFVLPGLLFAAGSSAFALLRAGKAHRDGLLAVQSRFDPALQELDRQIPESHCNLKCAKAALDELGRTVSSTAVPESQP